MTLPLNNNPPFATKKKKGLVIKPFRFLNNKSAVTVPQVYSHYKTPQLKKTSTRWYIEYYYRVPEELIPEYQKEWKRFRVFEDINRYKTDEYANVLLKAVRQTLQDGYNPFSEEREYFIKPVDSPVNWSLNTGLDQFITYCKDKRLRKKTIQSYSTLVNSFKEYFLKENRIYEPITSFTKDDLKRFFREKKKAWSNTTTNNYISFTKVIFNWFVKEDILVKSPALALEILPAVVTKHKYYSDEIADKLKKDIKVGDPELYEFLQFTYYCCTRPVSETRLLQNKSILFDRKLLFVPAHISKNKTDDYIPLGEDILSILENRKEQPREHYIFGGIKPRSHNHFAQKFKDYKIKYGLGADFSIYGFKHSRAIDLAKAGADPYQIMKLLRHTSLEITMAYLRDLGLTDFKEIHEKTKKF